MSLIPFLRETTHALRHGSTLKAQAPSTVDTLFLVCVVGRGCLFFFPSSLPPVKLFLSLVRRR